MSAALLALDAGAGPFVTKRNMGRPPLADEAMKTTVTLRLPNNVLEKLDRISEATVGKPGRQNLIREAIEHFVRTHPLPGEMPAPEIARKKLPTPKRR